MKNIINIAAVLSLISLFLWGFFGVQWWVPTYAWDVRASIIFVFHLIPIFVIGAIKADKEH